MVGVAARAEVGKQTVYRWWPIKAAVVAECILERFIQLKPITAAATGDTRADLITWLNESYVRFSEPGDVQLFRALNAASANDDIAARGLEERFTTPLRAAITSTLRAGVISTDINVDGVSELLLGRVLYSVVVAEPATSAEVETMVDLLLYGIASS